MAAISCSCPSSTTVNFSDGAGLDFTAAGADGFCVAFMAGGEVQDIRPVYAPGEAGAGTQNFVGGELDIEMRVTYVDDTELGCLTNFDTDCANLAAGAFSLDAGGVRTYDGCYLVGKPKLEQARATGIASTFAASASFSIKCVRP